ncbi:DUF4755 domain-containing protein [Acetobacter persici]|uniref:DUF4755 domain-containing protein n=1 Tax=Acetobacter persici TaxID=1076596 RepID=UPI0020CB83D1|nr:DUF4755 domain-containing protein [Acetobacter persici]MCP9319150.1 DUF4755 domain-containing protein [Acetobacter persici]
MIIGKYTGYYQVKKPASLLRAFILVAILVYVACAFAVSFTGTPEHPTTKTDALGLAVIGTGIFMVLGSPFTVMGYRLYVVKKSLELVEIFKKRLSVDFPKYMNRTFVHADYNPSARDYTPSCLAYDGKNIIIMNEGQYAILGWNDIRKWGWTLGSLQKTTGGSLSDACVNNMNDMSANMETARQSGFILTVADVNKPTWFFPTGFDKEGKAVCEKWMEIFKQIDEGRLPIEKVVEK